MWNESLMHCEKRLNFSKIIENQSSYHVTRKVRATCCLFYVEKIISISLSRDRYRT